MGAAVDLWDQYDAGELLEAADERIGPRIEACPDVVWYPQTPTPKQKAFMAIPEFEALYGGAAGGGKSSAILMDALRDVNVKNYSTIIFRKTYQDLSKPGALMDRAHEWLAPTAARWNGTLKQWRFPSKAVLTFGYLDKEKDKYNYQGGEYQSAYFDELTHITKASYMYIHSRIRRTEGSLKDVLLRVRGGTNPGGIGHRWVRARFGIRKDGTQDVKAAWNKKRNEARPFLPAGLADNPYLDAEEYELALSGLDKTTRDQLLNGLWVINLNGLVLPLSDGNLVDDAPDLPDLVHLLSIDVGSSDTVETLSFVVIAWSPSVPRVVWVRYAEKRTAMLHDDMADHIDMLDHRFGGFEQLVLDEGALGTQFSRELRSRHTLPFMPAKKNNRLGYSLLMRDAANSGHLRVSELYASVLIEEADGLRLIKDGQSMEGVCHAYDAALYGWRRARAHFSKAPPKRLKPGTIEHAKAMQTKLKAQLAQVNMRKRGKSWWMK